MCPKRRSNLGWRRRSSSNCCGKRTLVFQTRQVSSYETFRSCGTQPDGNSWRSWAATWETFGRSRVNCGTGVLPTRPNAMRRSRCSISIWRSRARPGLSSTSQCCSIKQRAAPGDLLKALSHAQRATVGQDFSQPWILWIQPVREVEGFEAGIAAARVAAGNVAPTKSLYAVYQYLGAYTRPR
jgi:hypothetical protein